MQTFWIDEVKTYDGQQLAPLYNYLQHGVLGDSIVSWQGPCKIPKQHMIDGEDLRANSVIEGDEMLHFVVELFQFPLSTAVLIQRLFGETLILLIQKLSGKKWDMVRHGDDVYWQKKKLNISIATCSQTSSLIHYGVNISNQGTPVETCALQDFGITDPEAFAQEFMDACKNEVISLKRAMVKVRSF